MRLRERAEEYAEVKNEGVGPLGQVVYSARHLGLLEQRELKMAAYEAGFREAIELAAQAAEKRVRCQSNPDMCREAEIIAKLIRALAEGGE